MKISLMKVQSSLVYAVEAVLVILFVVYLGFMTHYYVLFFDGTDEMFKYYKQLQVFNKEAFNLVLQFMVFGVVLFVLDLHKARPGLLSLGFAVAMTGFITMNSLFLIKVLPKYKRGYLALDFSSLQQYKPSTFVFDAALILHYVLIVLLVLLTVIAGIAFTQRRKEGKSLIRKLI